MMDANDQNPQDFTANTAGLFLLAVVFFGALFLGYVFLAGEEDLLLAPMWLRGLQFGLIALAVYASSRVAKYLPRVKSPFTGRYSSTPMLPYIVFVFCFLFSHGLIWGGLHHLHLGEPFVEKGLVVEAGHKNGKSSGGHGEWVDLQLTNNRGEVHLETNALYPLQSAEGDPDHTYACAMETALSGDFISIAGKRSVFGYAVESFTPMNPRLIKSCEAH